MSVGGNQAIGPGGRMGTKLTATNLRSGETQLPPTVLLATDLSSRCDRALDRAIKLATTWQARLVILTAVEPPSGDTGPQAPSWRHAPDPLRAARVQLRRDLGRAARRVEVVVSEGDAVDAILKTARAEGAGLLVTGVARDETFGRRLVGATVERLAGQSPAPILCVRTRLRPYREVLVASDHTAKSQDALATAARMFPFARLTLLHAWQVPFRGFLDKGPFRDDLRAERLRAGEAFVIQTALCPGERARLTLRTEEGLPDQLVAEYMRDQAVDLVVVGINRSRGPLDRRLGGAAKRILDAAPGDVLLVPGLSETADDADRTA